MTVEATNTANTNVTARLEIFQQNLLTADEVPVARMERSHAI